MFGRNLLLTVVSVIVALSVEARVWAAEPHRTSFECRWTDEAITIDGEAQEGAWEKADTIDDFYLPWLQENARSARTKTTAKLLWDRENLYLFAQLEDHDLFADITQRDGMTWLNDVCELFLKPSDDRPGYYEFQVNAAGTEMDMFLPKREPGGYEKYIHDGEFHMESKVVRKGTLNMRADQDEGWSVEIKIPWYSFLRTGGRPQVNETWKFAICRYDYSKEFDGPELSTCAPLNKKNAADFHSYEGYASLTFKGVDAKTTSRPLGIERYTPLTTSRVIGSPEPPPPFRAERIWPQLRMTWPIYATMEPGSDRLLVIDQKNSSGKSRLGRVDLAKESAEVETLHEFDGTAYSIAFHPRFADNGFIYIGWNGPATGTDKKSKVTRHTLSRTEPFQIVPNSEQLIIEWESDGHNGAAVTFGLDGMLYITSGDGTSDSDTNLKGQGLDHLLSKVLRIDVDHPAEGKAYSVPKDNPFVEMPGARPETWAYGFRNPWRITTDEKTGHIWVGNNGQDLFEQAFLVERGANYGWSVYEGSQIFYANRELGPTPHVPPTVEHPHSEFRSLTGGVVYYGENENLREFVGAYIYGDYSTGKVWGVKVDDEWKVTWSKELADTTLQISGFFVDHRGELIVIDHRGSEQGGFYALRPNPVPADSAAAFPRKLSETGLFASVKEHRVQSALIPYSVNAPLWSDGSHKERFMALPGEKPEIEVTPTRGWNFPDQTVLVKSFALNLDESNPASRRWIETRLLTKQEGEWFGYTYLWNDDQTDAELVPASGADRTFTIQTSSGKREQTWHYPSRTECMVCHSRAANYVLGPTTWQLNKDHDYGGHRDNQLRVLEHLGILKMDWKSEAVAQLRQAFKAAGKSDAETESLVAKQSASSGQRAAARTTMWPRPPASITKLADPYDSKEPLDLRARSYLQANCAHCHVSAGGGNAQIDLEFSTAADKRNLFDAKPLHHTFGIQDARLIAPGDPQRSVLLYRMAHRGSGQMPQLASSMIDQSAVELIRQWILEMK